MRHHKSRDKAAKRYRIDKIKGIGANLEVYDSNTCDLPEKVHKSIHFSSKLLNKQNIQVEVANLEHQRSFIN